MTNVNMITVSPVEMHEHTFKDAYLTKATQKIEKIYTDAVTYAEDKNREIAKILSDVAAKNAYAKDGFKSVADYAAQTFGMQKSRAYALANAGKVYNDKNAPEQMKALSPFKLAELNRLIPSQAADAITSGAITENSTEKEIREYVTQKIAETEKPKVLPSYTVRICGQGFESIMETLTSPRTVDAWDELFTNLLHERHPGQEVTTVSLPKASVNPDSKKKTISRRLYICHDEAAAIELFEYRQEKPKPERAAKKPKFTREQLMAMLAEMDDEPADK